MKALSIHPEPVMDIFMGEKPFEYRTWKTDYRSDLLICAGAKKQPGFVNGNAYFVVALEDIQLCPAKDDDEEEAPGHPVYAWRLGAPRLIRPIPVRGQLFLF